MTTFPADFTWGTATSSYQIEGAANEGGRGPTIWDAFCQLPGTVDGNCDGSVACDHYHRVEEDVQLLADLGVTAYRFSIAWSRIQPSGSGAANPDGIAFYNRLIDALLAKDITPWVTLYHWDLPLALELREGGWLNPGIAERFAEYARICFDAFGDRVKHWITLNEPWCSALLGYAEGCHAPGRSYDPDQALDAGHNLLRAHAQAVRIYRQEFAQQAGQIGITNNCDWREPASDDPADQAAAQTALECFLGWFADPVYTGDYPASMRRIMGERLPRFSAEESALLRGSSDFFGLNHYSTAIASAPGTRHGPQAAGNGGVNAGSYAEFSSDPAWPVSDMDWPIVPDGCRKMLRWIADRYDNPPLYITENGMAHGANPIHDQPRVEFFRDYLNACGQAIAEGVNLRGYFAWSLLDNFEWAWGYDKRFGIVHVDYATQQRTPKDSYRFLQQVFARGAIPEAGAEHSPATK